MPYGAVNGRRLYYEVGGEGETVVLLHGSFANADILEGPATAIASGFRALRLDRRGHGRSSDAPEPLALADEASEIAALLDWFSTDKAHLLAHDDGAEVALQFALDYPGRVLSLALLAPTLEGFAWKEETRAARHELLAAFVRDPRKAIAEKWLPSRIFDVARGSESTIEHLEDIYGAARVAGGSLERPAHAGPPQAQRLGEIRARTAVLVGDREDAERIQCASAIARGIRGAEGMTFEGLSRFLHMEDGRRVMRRLTDFYIPPEE
ncbi:MAG TPA: alpha/beta hydrolase [Thermoanaerobaculia bacterium]|nr:alpha/beta hydrolase [Thermoanaerobaculia bacterium]